MDIANTLIDAATLAALPTDTVLIVDCRHDLADTGAGARAYAAGHVPGALHAHLDRDLSDLSRKAAGLGRHPLPAARDFIARLARWGWRPPPCWWHCVPAPTVHTCCSRAASTVCASMPDR